MEVRPTLDRKALDRYEARQLLINMVLLAIYHKYGRSYWHGNGFGARAIARVYKDTQEAEAGIVATQEWFRQKYEESDIVLWLKYTIVYMEEI